MMVFYIKGDEFEAKYKKHKNKLAIRDYFGQTFLVKRQRQTSLGFKIYLGLPLVPDEKYIPGIAYILTNDLAEYLFNNRFCQNNKQLPISANKLIEFRRRLDLPATFSEVRQAQITNEVLFLKDDLLNLIYPEFVQKHPSISISCWRNYRIKLEEMTDFKIPEYRNEQEIKQFLRVNKKLLLSNKTNQELAKHFSMSCTNIIEYRQRLRASLGLPRTMIEPDEQHGGYSLYEQRHNQWLLKHKEDLLSNLSDAKLAKKYNMSKSGMVDRRQRLRVLLGMPRTLYESHAARFEKNHQWLLDHQEDLLSSMTNQELADKYNMSTTGIHSRRVRLRELLGLPKIVRNFKDKKDNDVKKTAEEIAQDYQQWLLEHQEDLLSSMTNQELADKYNMSTTGIQVRRERLRVLLGLPKTIRKRKSKNI